MLELLFSALICVVEYSIHFMFLHHYLKECKFCLFFYVASTKSTSTSKKIPKIISVHIESMKIMYSPLTNGVSETSKELI